MRIEELLDRLKYLINDNDSLSNEKNKVYKKIYK